MVSCLAVSIWTGQSGFEKELMSQLNAILIFSGVIIAIESLLMVFRGTGWGSHVDPIGRPFGTSPAVLILTFLPNIARQLLPALMMRVKLAEAAAQAWHVL
jgi:hypothetical protein